MERSSNKQKQLEDLKLIEKIRAGDSASLEKLLDRYIPQLMGFFRYLRVSDSIIEDMIQETFEKVIRKIDTFDSSKSFSSWIMTIGRNHYFDECRRENRKREKQVEMQLPSQQTPEEEIIVRETATELLKLLSDQEKFLVEMRVFQGAPFSEIAEITGEAEGTLRSRFFRTMGRLKISGERAKAAE